MTPALQAAVQKLIDSGAYAQILDNWGVSNGGIPRPSSTAPSTDHVAELRQRRMKRCRPRVTPAIIAVPLRHPWRWVAAVALLVLAAMLVNSLLTNPAWDWPTVGQYLFSPQMLRAVWLTVWVTVPQW